MSETEIDAAAAALLEALEAVRPSDEAPAPIAHCPKCGAAWFHDEGFCGGRQP
jgi:hypothetical protein